MGTVVYLIDEWLCSGVAMSVYHCIVFHMQQKLSDIHTIEDNVMHLHIYGTFVQIAITRTSV